MSAMLETGLVGAVTKCNYHGPHVLFSSRPAGADTNPGGLPAPVLGFDVERTSLPRLGGGPVGSRSALRALARIDELQNSGTGTLANVHVDKSTVVRALHLLHPTVS
eukprot:6007353-Amphidinium_carterae.1